MSSHDKNSCCGCCHDGRDGRDGPDGADGPAGNPGNPGQPGIQGRQGNPGASPSHCVGYMWNMREEDVDPNAVIAFDFNTESGTIIAPDSSHLKVSEAGTYLFSFYVHAAFSGPSDLPFLFFGISINGAAPVASNSYATFTSLSGDFNVGSLDVNTMLTLAAGDTVSLVNLSLNTNTLPNDVNSNVNASMSLECYIVPPLAAA